MCVLPLNMINQKFYAFFYIWLAFLLVASLSMLVIRIGFLLSAELRLLALKSRYGIKGDFVSKNHISSYLLRDRTYERDYPQTM